MSSNPPTRAELSIDAPHFPLFRRVREAIYALPASFETETLISGILATDIYTLNAALGAAIEHQVVETLNALRSIWDPDDSYRLYRFIRQSQTFPDVLLKSVQRDLPGAPVLLGIELKGWYLLAKEGMPSFRYQVTPSACALQDLIVVVPWALSNVISGVPKVFDPYVESARYAAEYRNYHWQYVREAKTAPDIEIAIGASPYPMKSDAICDRPVSDSGSNFGRLARCGIMDDYIAGARRQPLCGIEAQYWLQFFRIFQDRAEASAYTRSLDQLKHRIQKLEVGDNPALNQLGAIIDALRALLELM
ncbi:MAG TPA: hypothetical protein VFJ58_10790 [Armatimonadota bacterium]|nr:hypothetical protein [Armatimonadota bacterium]